MRRGGGGVGVGGVEARWGREKRGLGGGEGGGRRDGEK